MAALCVFRLPILHKDRFESTILMPWHRILSVLYFEGIVWEYACKGRALNLPGRMAEKEGLIPPMYMTTSMPLEPSTSQVTPRAASAEPLCF